MKDESLLGSVEFIVPATATEGQSYTIRFSAVDGAPDIRTQYDLESLPGNVWVNSPALAPDEVISDEWKLKFFGSLNNPLGANGADPDGDGVKNIDEYRAGKQPTKLHLHGFSSERSEGQNGGSFKLRWFAESGRSYVVERSGDLSTWSSVAGQIAGNSDIKEINDSAASAETFFYRVRVQR